MRPGVGREGVGAVVAQRGCAVAGARPHSHSGPNESVRKGRGRGAEPSRASEVRADGPSAASVDRSHADPVQPAVQNVLAVPWRGHPRSNDPVSALVAKRQVLGRHRCLAALQDRAHRLVAEVPDRIGRSYVSYDA